MRTTTALPFEITLAPDEAREALEWSSAFTASPYGDQWAAFSHAVAGATDRPRWIDKAAQTFTGAPGAASLLVSGLPVALDRPTPSAPFVELREPTGTEALLTALAVGIGQVVSLADWHEGDRVQNLYPLASEASQQNASNAVYLELHTESAFRPATPDAVLLLCLRGDDTVKTFVSDLAEAWSRLGDGTRQALSEPHFGFPTPEGATPPLPIARRAECGWVFDYAEALVACSPERAEALDELRAEIDGGLVEVSLRQGDLLVIDNTQVVHGRSAYEPRYDGTDRWLQRCLVSGGRRARAG